MADTSSRHHVHHHVSQATEVQQHGSTPAHTDCGSTGHGAAVASSCATSCCGPADAHGHGHGCGVTVSWTRLAFAGGLALAAELTHWFTAPGWVTLALALVAIALSGIGVYQSGLRSLARLDFNINALMSIAVTGALILGHWPEAAMVMALFALAEAIEERSMDNARHAVERLMQVAPDRVTARDAAGNWAEKSANEVQIGEILRAKPGERIGLDGQVSLGSSSVNQSAITGESMPVTKTVGDRVYAGSVNGLSELEYRVDARFDATLLSRIVHAVQQAQAQKAPVQRMVDRFSRIYTPLIVLFAALLAVVPPLLFGGEWSEWIYKALVLLVIACPCALVISTPVAIVSGLASAAKQGILIKGGVYLEEARKLAWLALDKTGTLTQGRPELTDVWVADSSIDPSLCRRWAHALAARSDHPVSQAIAQAGVSAASSSSPLVSSNDGTVGDTPLAVEKFEARPGEGVQGEVDGRSLFLGSVTACPPTMMQGASGEKLAEQLSEWQLQGKTVSVLADSDRILAAFAVADTLKPTSVEGIEHLHRLGVRTAVVSGDHNTTAQYVATLAGIDAVHADMLPEDKLAVIQEYGKSGRVGMVGDGINDAPALAAADIGFAMGAMGSDIAIETADVALMDDDLRKLPRFIELSRSTYAILIQNIVMALGIKLVFVVMTLLGLATMWMAVFADVGASLLVIANSLRLLRK